MDASGSLSLAQGAGTTWAWRREGTGRQPTGILIALAVHGLAAWLVLSGAGLNIVRETLKRTTVIVLPPPEPEPPLVLRPQPPNPRSAAQQPLPIPVLVPEPEQPPAASPETPVLASQPGNVAELAAQPGTTSGPPATQGPRGFGSIVNRAECSAAFAQSYPREARRGAQQGAVTLQVRVAASGVIEAAEVINAQPRRVFERAALGVILSGACRFESDAAGYVAVLEVSYRLAGDAPD